MGPREAAYRQEHGPHLLTGAGKLGLERAVLKDGLEEALQLAESYLREVYDGTSGAAEGDLEKIERLRGLLR
jgi:hypothetical protein